MLLVLLLAQPLKKRLLYHFTGNKKINSLEKVECLWRITRSIMPHVIHYVIFTARVVSVSSVGVDQRSLFISRGEDSAIAWCYWSGSRCEGEGMMVAEAADIVLVLHRHSSSAVCSKKLMKSYVMICRHCQIMKWLLLILLMNCCPLRRNYAHHLVTISHYPVVLVYWWSRKNSTSGLH